MGREEAESGDVRAGGTRIVFSVIAREDDGLGYGEEAKGEEGDG